MQWEGREGGHSLTEEAQTKDRPRESQETGELDYSTMLNHHPYSLCASFPDDDDDDDDDMCPTPL